MCLCIECQPTSIAIGYYYQMLILKFGWQKYVFGNNDTFYVDTKIQKQYSSHKALQ